MIIPPILKLVDIQQRYPQALFCDVRYALDGSDGYQAYLKGHIPGARYVSMDRDLASTAGPIVGRHPLPPSEAFAKSLGDLGIRNEDIVVAYDGVGGRFAGRLVWLLRVIGQPAALVDGGLQAWLDQQPPQSLETEVPVWRSVTRQVIPWPAGAVATADEVSTAIAAGHQVFDSRAPERYRGDMEPLDPKAGHVPGAKNLFFGDNYAGGGNYFKSSDELTKRFSDAGFDANTIVYCGSGVTACINALAAESAGRPRPRIYVGSWSGWASSDRPIETGTAPS